MCRRHSSFEHDFASSVRLTSSEAISRHLELDWVIDFAQCRIIGHVDIRCESQQEGPCELHLDSRDLAIQSVMLIDSETKLSDLKFMLNDSGYPVTLGSRITVSLPDSPREGHEYRVRIHYSTTLNSSALQWLSCHQTNSKKYPFLFSQSQAIHARSMIPCQDLCQVKVTYNATIRSPSELTVLMSAIRDGDAVPCAAPDGILYPSECNASAGWSVTRYEQPVCIPAYLIAIACGELEGRKIGPRSTVWGEPDVVVQAAWEFQDTEKMIQEAEKLCGPYRFGVYDILVLNRGFPYGGMENVNLTFVTPTLLAGDRSQVAVIAHELAHSWSGNLVTNKTWNNFWINEGLTVFTETKIVKALFGAEAADIRLEEGWDHLGQFVHSVGSGHNYTRLCPEMADGDDPDDAFSVVPYEKGASLFWFLESLVGPDSFEPFIVNFFNDFEFKSISTMEFARYTSQRFPEVQIDWTGLFMSPGMPLYKPPVDMTVIEDAKSLAKKWLSASHEEVPRESPDVSLWPSGKKCIFINALLEKSSGLDGTKIRAIAEAYKFLDTNCEVRCSFITLMLQVAPLENSAKEHAVNLATEQGRMKYTRPIYRNLFIVDKELAQTTFLKHKKQYHPICVKMVSRDLEL